MKKLVSIIALLIICSVNLLAKETIIYPSINGLGKNSFGYDVLKLALSKVNEEYEIEITQRDMNGARATDMLAKGEISVVDVGISEKRAKQFDIIYRPIDMGLLGWRIFIINKDLQDDFHKIKDLEGLKTKSAGQGPTWPDRYIIENSGIKVVTSPKIQFLVNMVEAKRFDFFPLGASEAHGFLKRFAADKKDLVIEDSVALVYPFGRFFYVQKGNEKLKKDLESGLDKAFEDGSFQELVLNHPFFKEGLDKSKLENRTVIRIDNPFLPKEFSTIDPKWWYKIK